MDVRSAKRELRRTLAAKRRSAAPDVAARAAESAAHHLVRSEAFRSANNVAIYVGIDGELDTRFLFDEAIAAGRRVVAPRSLPDQRLEFAELDAWERLVPARFGVPEPPPGARAVALDARDLVVVPGLAFDLEGGRLGRGAGYYDRVFPVDATCPQLVGYCFSFQVVARVPTDCHDRRMDAICTEEALHRVEPTPENV